MKLNADWHGLLHLGRMSGGYFITTFIDSAIPLLLLPILTRYLPPAEYANIALFSFYLVLSNSLTGVSIHAVISKHFFDQPKELLKKIVGNSIIIVFGFSLLTMLFILMLYPCFGRALDLPLLWLLCIPLASFAYVVFSMGLNVLRNNKEILSYSLHQVGNTALNALFSLFLVVVLLRGWQGRVWGIILALFLSAAWSFYYLRANGYVSFAFSRDVGQGIMNVVLPLVPNSVQSVIISQVGIFFIQYFFSKKLLGVYAVGFQIAFAARLLIDTLGLSWSPFLYQQLAKTREMDKLFVMRLYYSLIGIVFLGIVFINVFSGLILRIMTTPEFFGAREFIPWFTLGFLFHGMYIFLLPILIKHDQQRYISMVSILNMLVMIGLNIGFIRWFGYIGVAYAYCLSYFLMFLALAGQSQKVFPLPWLKALKIWN